MLWEGSIPLQKVVLTSTSPPSLFEKEEEQIQSNWESLLSKHPHWFDGDITLYHSHEKFPDHFQLKISKIRFSEFLYLRDLHPHKLVHYGNLGVKVHLYDQSRQNILIGKRSNRVVNKPGMISTVGGVVEWQHVDKGLQNLCYEEIEEESSISPSAIDAHSFYLRGIQRETDNSAINLIIDAACSYSAQAHKHVKGNAEWTNHTMWWQPVATIFEVEDLLEHFELI